MTTIDATASCKNCHQVYFLSNEDGKVKVALGQYWITPKHGHFSCLECSLKVYIPTTA